MVEASSPRNFLFLALENVGHRTDLLRIFRDCATRGMPRQLRRIHLVSEFCFEVHHVLLTSLANFVMNIT